ncbi:MAG TPA: CocE/NonD family hydrolase [Candidatus Dormibacteraeota bacterium]|nr:CocE/NonD family hydrolase [Candidatus Dormibacteraeota bacterium]
MFGVDWQVSPRRFGVRQEPNFQIPLADGNRLVGNLFRPDTDRPVPVLLSMHAYNNEYQTANIRPAGFSYQRGWIEAGDPQFFARRGYAHGIFNVRGTGASTGEFQLMGPREVEDVAEAIEWLATQPWCNGQVGMFGISYFASIQLQVAMLRPPSLRAIFAPFGLTDFYRDMWYHGGILSQRFLLQWKDKFDAVRYRSWYLQQHGEQAFREAIAAALDDEEISEVPGLVQALRAPEGADALVTDIVLQPLDGPFYEERRVDYRDTQTPAYLGACWALFGLHLPGAFRSWERWQGPKKLIIGPALYLDRPFYQMHWEALRWFDHWLLGNDTGFMEEPPIRLFLPGTGRWRTASSWPLPETRWTPFMLHEGGLLSEHELWAGEHSTSFEDSPFGHGEVVFLSPKLVEETEILGPMVLELHLSTTDIEALVMASVFSRQEDGAEEELTRGWLRASSRELDEVRSRPWQPHPSLSQRRPLVPDEVVSLRIALTPGARCLRPGERLGLRIKLADDEAPPDAIRGAGYGHLQRSTAARIQVHHREQYPSQLLVPITGGNYLGTFLSGGELPPVTGPLPLAKFRRPKGI